MAANAAAEAAAAGAAREDSSGAQIELCSEPPPPAASPLALGLGTSASAGGSIGGSASAAGALAHGLGSPACVGQPLALMDKAGCDGSQCCSDGDQEPESALGHVPASAAAPAGSVKPALPGAAGLSDDDLIRKLEELAAAGGAQLKAKAEAVDDAKNAAQAAKAKGKAKAKATANGAMKRPAAAEEVSQNKVKLGCGKCRGTPSGCDHCRNPSFKGSRWTRTLVDSRKEAGIVG